MNTDADRPAFAIGKRTGEHLAITPLHRSNDECEDYWDGNWIECAVEVQVPGFRGEIGATLRTPDFAGLRDDLERLYDDLSGEAKFETMETWVEFTIEGDRRGHYRVTGLLRDDPNTRNSLSFVLEFDQTEIPGMLRDLDRVIEAWPVRGL